MPPSLLDTNILSAIMRGQPAVSVLATSYLAIHGRFTISVMTRYEIVRGLKARRASRRLQEFEQFCAVNEILPLTDPVFERAADIYADLHRRGKVIGDADTLIAATALEHRLAIATNNVSHFARITGLTVQDWLAP